MLYGYYPTLGHREYAICKIIADTLWDLQDDAIYLEVILRAEDKLSELFEDRNEIDEAIKGLMEKRIVECKSRDFWFGSKSKGKKVLKSLKILNLRRDVEVAISSLTSLSA